MKIGSRYEHPVGKMITEWGKDMCQQHFANEVNMHQIIERSQRTLMPPMSGGGGRPPIFGDFSEVKNYQDAMEQLIVSEEAFMELSPEVRLRFSNDPGELLEFIEHPENKEEAIRLGLVEATVVEAAKAIGEDLEQITNPISVPKGKKGAKAQESTDIT